MNPKSLLVEIDDGVFVDANSVVTIRAFESEDYPCVWVDCFEKHDFRVRVDFPNMPEAIEGARKIASCINVAIAKASGAQVSSLASDLSLCPERPLIDIGKTGLRALPDSILGVDVESIPEFGGWCALVHLKTDSVVIIRYDSENKAREAQRVIRYVTD